MAEVVSGGGLAEVGQASFLTEAQQKQLAAAAATGPFATAQTVRDGIEGRFGVVYTVGSLYTLLPLPRHTQAAPLGPGGLEQRGLPLAAVGLKAR